MANVAIKNLTRQHLKVVAGLPFEKIANEVLPGWDLSLAFVGPAKARALNKQLRGKDYTPNVLSYAVGEKSAEIIICPSSAAKQAPDFQLPASSFQLLLFIHGLLHIKGMKHGATMERCEHQLLTKYVKAPSDRDRHRHVSGQDRRRRRSL